ncbi:hypothetical protein OH460_08135 [Vibrio sp. Makdt]|uniref:hypothetical protein n=1 Tax=Vibrio sp. Makdt TaxID=2998828 RepID=UPI0022CD76E7|nr:hypothetical protein [Vibrio sp. Makdt]MDA0152267.1 hypothetical protein [Vibrio sp. Makdt]
MKYQPNATWHPTSLIGWILILISFGTFALAVLVLMSSKEIPYWMPCAMIGFSLMGISTYLLEHKKFINFPAIFIGLIGMALFIVPRLIN